MTALWQDILYGCRMLFKNPGFTTVAVISIALGIGANTTIFSLINATLLSSLTFPEPDRLVVIWNVPVQNRTQRGGVSAATFLGWKERSRSFEHVGAVYNYVRSLGKGDDGSPPEQVQSQRFTPGMFHALGVRPLLGRLFTDEEDRIGDAAPVALISHGFWQRKFAGDPNIVGKTMRLDGVVYTVIGVMPPDFGLLNQEADLWEPCGISQTQLQSTASYLVAAGRLKPGVSIAQAQAEMDGIAAQLAEADPARNKNRGVRLEPLQEVYFGGLREPLFVLQGVVAFVLLIACANVAGLLLARASSRRIEVAVRSAIGADRWRIVRQLLTESVLIAMLGGLLGVAVGWVGLRLFIATAPPGLPGLDDFSIDVRVLAFTAAVSIVTGLVFGLLPALQSSKANLAGAIKESGRGAMGGLARHRLRSVLVTGQIALALVLLIGAGLMINTFVRLQRNDLGADPRGVLTFEVRFPEDEMMKVVGRYRGVGLWEISPVTALTFNRIFERMQGLPAVQSAAGSTFPPLSGAMAMNFIIAGRPAPAPGGTGATSQPQTNAAYLAVTPNFFATMKIPILRGRDFNDRDTQAAPPVVIINQTMARRFWPDEDPIGQRITLDFVPDEQPRQIIAVVGDTRFSPYEEDPPAVMYVPHMQQTPRWQGPSWNARARMTFMLRTAGDPMALIPAVRAAVAEIDPGKPVSEIRTVEQSLNQRLQGTRLYTGLLVVFGVIAGLLAAVGIYGVMAYSVGQRTHEIGVRMALGAMSRDVMGLVFRQAALMIVFGLVIGLAGSFALTRFLGDALWGVTPTDPPTFGAVSLGLILVAALACLIPTLRAMRVNPTIALRYE